MLTLMSTKWMLSSTPIEVEVEDAFTHHILEFLPQRI